MFLIADDERRVVDTRGRIVGFIIRNKFTQSANVADDGSWVEVDKVYSDGLSPLELEIVSEVIESNNLKKETNGKVL